MDVQVVIEGRNGERRLESLSVQGPLSVGRDAQCTLCVPGELVSRKHARIELGATSLRVEDTSSNGTLAGVAVLRKTATEVPYGTPIVIGHYALYIHPGRERDASDAPAEEPLPAVEQGEDAPESEAPPTPPEVVVLPAASPTGELRREIHRRLLEHLDLATTDAARLDDPAFRPRVLVGLRRIVTGMADRLPDGCDADRLIGEMADEVLGLGPLEALLADPAVSEIMVIDANTIYVERSGKIQRSTASFTDEDRVRAVIERIVTPLGRRIDESSPLVDARLADGSRVNAIIRPLALRGSCITIRKFARVPLTLHKLFDLGALTPAMGRFLTRSVIAKKNLVIAGGTGSGKTTLLNVLSAAIPPDERIVTIEDSAELHLPQPHVVSLETRPPNMEGKGAYSIRDLVKNALRMRPDRIVVGECRGGEALDMLQAMNTGHDGSLTTTHANSPEEALGRQPARHGHHRGHGHRRRG